MSTKSIIIILIRLIALYTVLQALSILPTFVSIFSSDPVMFLLSSTSVMLILSVVLWFTAPELANLMVKGIISDDNSSIELSKTNIEVLIFLTIGLIMITESLPSLANLLTYNSILDRQVIDAATIEQISTNAIGSAVEYIIKIVIGSIFVLYAPRLGNFFRGALNKGTSN